MDEQSKSIDDFVKGLLLQKAGDEVEGEEYSKAFSNLRQLFVEYLNAHIIDALPADKIDAINRIAGDTDPEELSLQVDEIVSKANLDLTLITKNAASAFTTEYLHTPLDDEE
jgi:hypothetical protein